METYRKFRFARSTYRLIILLGTAIFVGIPDMYNSFLANIDNAKNNYGVYTLQEIKEANIDDPKIEKIEAQLNYYNSYFKQVFSDVEIEESISYLKSGISANYLMYLSSNTVNKPSYQIQAWSDDNNKMTWSVIRFMTAYNGDAKEAFSYVDKKELEHICNYYNFENAYNTLESMMTNIDLVNNSARKTGNNGETYKVLIYDHDNPNIKQKTMQFEIEKKL